MADFNALVNDVYTLTKKPNLIEETKLAVKSATLQLHRQEFFSKDLLETALQYSENAYFQTIVYRSLFPRYRSTKYIRKYDMSTGIGVAGKFLIMRTPDEMLDSYGVELADVWYLAGDVIQVKSSDPIQYSLIGVYLNPDISSESNYTSWIADEAPYAVVYQAASIVFGNVLKDKTARDTNLAMAQMEFTQIKNSNILDVGE